MFACSTLLLVITGASQQISRLHLSSNLIRLLLGTDQQFPLKASVGD
jgi:hypothetical protein